MWTGTQRRILAAMGYTLYARAAALPATEAAPAASAATESPAIPRVPREDDRLWQAVRRAAAGRDVTALVGDLEALRRDPGRKRALWPKLRAMRRH